jgi:hypothetical protein
MATPSLLCHSFLPVPENTCPRGRLMMECVHRGAADPPAGGSRLDIESDPGERARQTASRIVSLVAHP